MRGSPKEPELTAVLIAADRELAQRFVSSLAEARMFTLISELKSYPSESTLDLRLRQAPPDVVFIDLAQDQETALGLVRHIAGTHPQLHIVGLHHQNDAQVLIRLIRAGGREFLYAPFQAESQREAAQRLRRLLEPEPEKTEFGRVVAFSSAKPGSGATTLATQTAFGLRRLAGKRVLLIDLDLQGGSVAFNLKLSTPYSVMDAMERSDRLDPETWSALTASVAGIDVLPGPDRSDADTLESSRLHEVLECARMMYDWVIIDLPNVFHRNTIYTISESELCLLVSTAELPSLHLARRAVGMLGQLGFERERFQVIVNRLDKRQEISSGDLEKILSCPLFSTLPNDYHSLHRMVARAESFTPEGDLGKALESTARKITQRWHPERKPASPAVPAAS